MNIIICGAGQVGSHAAEVLAEAGHNITVIDNNQDRLNSISEVLDIATLYGNCAAAETLILADAKNADLVVAATNCDEINLLTSAVAKGISKARTIARVHHQTYFEQHGLDYKLHLGIDRLLCPEYSTAQAIASTLRNPGAIAIENFARGKIEMHEFVVSDDAPSIKKPLSQVKLPRGTRLAAISRNGEAFIPGASSEVEPGDRVVLVGNSDTFMHAREQFLVTGIKRRKVVIMGGPPMASWLCRALKDRDYSIRLFETNRERAEEIAENLNWVTVIQADPTESDVANDEHLDQADVFVALTNSDENNIMGSATALHLGIRETITVVQQPNYLRLLNSIGIHKTFSPRHVAATEIVRFIDTGAMKRISSLAEGIIGVFWVRAGTDAKVINLPLRELKLTPDWMIAVIKRGDDIHVPGADEMILEGDAVLVIGKHGKEKQLLKLFATH